MDTLPNRRARRTDDTEAGWSEVASVDPTDACNDILGCFGRSDRSALVQREGSPPEAPATTPALREIRMAASDGRSASFDGRSRVPLQQIRDIGADLRRVAVPLVHPVTIDFP